MHYFIIATTLLIDGTSALAMIRTFFDVLSLPPSSTVPDLQARLALCVGVHSVSPNKHLSSAQIRWRQAAGQIIRQSRRQRLRGGTTLPRTITTSKKLKTPLSRKATITFSRDRSSLVVASCRKHFITIGSVLSVLSQMGSARVLHRRYFRGEMAEEQWDDQEWYESGGAEVLSQHRSKLEDGTHPFSALLPQDRFVRRGKAVKKQFKDILTHPLLFEIGVAYHTERPLAGKAAVEKWKKFQAGEKPEEVEEPILDLLSNDYLFYNGGASIGNIDPLRPTEYPPRFDNPLSSRNYFTKLEDAPPEISTRPTIEIVKSWKKLSVRAAEFYLGAETKDQELSIFVSWDGNVYEDELVKEWLQEIRKATEYYLC